MGNRPSGPNGLLTSPSAVDTEIKYFDCSYPGCSFKSKWLGHVARHEKIHQKSASWDLPCRVCHRSFGSLASFFHHMSSRHADKLFCSFCQFVAQDLTQFKPHILTHSHSFASNFNSRSSKRTTTDFRCSTCYKSFSVKGNLTRHLKNNRCKVKHTPATVGRLKAQTQTLSRDVNGKAGPVFRCNTCSTSFTVKWSLYRHQVNNRCRSKSFRSAGKKTRNVPSFKARKTERTDEESRNGVGKVVQVQRALHACQQCSFRTAYVHNLYKHQRVHTGERPFKCPNLGCDYRARWVQNIRSHQQKHCRAREIESKSSIEGKESLREAVKLVNKTQVNAESSSSSVALACKFCNFIGDTEVSALKHSCEHKSVVILLNRI